MSIDLEDFEDDYDPDYEPHCLACNDSGKIVADDGYHEYLGNSHIPCRCSSGTQWIGMLRPNPLNWPES